MKRANLKIDLSSFDTELPKLKREPSLEHMLSSPRLSPKLERVLSSPKLSPKLPKLKRATPKLLLDIKQKDNEDDIKPRTELKFKPKLDLSKRRVSDNKQMEGYLLLNKLKTLSPEVNNLEKYEKINKPLASGAFGIVNFYYKKDDPNGKLYIIKVISYVQGKEGKYNDEEIIGVYNRLINEILSLQRLEKENCKDTNKVDLCFIETFSDDKNIYIVTQFKNDTTSLDDFMKTNKFTIIQIICYIFILLGKLKMLHLLSIVHNDIKPANILVQYDKNQIVDFSYIDYGECCLCNENSVCNTSGTTYYHPENVLFYTHSNCNLTYYSDIYSLGITINEMMTKSNIKDDQLTTFVKDKMLNEDMYDNQYNIVFLDNLIKDFSEIFKDKLKECK